VWYTIHMSPLLLLIANLLACKNFTTLEEACHDKVPGEQHVNSNGEIDAMWRINCYRRLVGLPRGRINKRVQEATENHMSYLKKNQEELIDGASFFRENNGWPGFTGVDVQGRLDKVEYEWDGSPTGWGIWEHIWLDEFTKSKDRIDFWAHDPYSRETFLQPSWVDGGYAQSPIFGSGQIGYLVIFYDFPAPQRADRPILFPKDEMEQVPPTYLSYDSFDPLCGQELGFPITITVGSDNATGGFGSSSNPYDLKLDFASLHGPDGAVKLDTRQPGDGKNPGGFLLYTVAAIPLTPLKPNSWYTFEAAITWNVGEKDVSASFKTAAKTKRPLPPFDPFCLYVDPDASTDDGTGGGGGTTTGGGTSTGGGTDPENPWGRSARRFQKLEVPGIR
jgi:hypothetical protein